MFIFVFVMCGVNVEWLLIFSLIWWMFFVFLLFLIMILDLLFLILIKKLVLRNLILFNFLSYIFNKENMEISGEF